MSILHTNEIHGDLCPMPCATCGQRLVILPAGDGWQIHCTACPLPIAAAGCRPQVSTGPTAAQPGSADKLAVMMARATAGTGLNHPRDLVDLDGQEDGAVRLAVLILKPVIAAGRNVQPEWPTRA